MGAHSERLLIADSNNRALRTFVQGLAIDVTVGVLLVLATYFADADGWGDIQWAVLGFSLSKSVVQAAAAYVMRRFLDKSRVPTPLPPDPQAEPAEPVEEGVA